MAGIFASCFENGKREAAKFGNMVAHQFGRFCEPSNQPCKIVLQFWMLIAVIISQ